MVQHITDHFWQAEAKSEETRQFIKNIKRENARLKQLVAELSLQVHVLKKTAIPGLSCPVAGLWPSWGYPGAPTYRWLKRQTEERLEDRKGGSSLPWNKLSPEEEAVVLAEARASPELSAQQLAFKITDSGNTYISESTVYRILKREGLIKPAEIIGFKAGKEYRRKTKRINELWASDCCHLRVTYWGWHYLETVMNDFSCFILS